MDIKRASHRPRPGIRLTVAVLVAAAALVAAGCSSAATGGGGSSAPASANPSAATSASAEAYEVTVVQDAKLGSYLAGEDGKTLYVFTKDSKDKSVCNADCAAKWPPFVLDPGETVKGGAGVTGTFGTVTRDDGKAQVTYDGAPLYYFAKDAKAGDVNGQGIGGVWFVASVAGGPGGQASAPASSGTGYNEGKYGNPSSGAGTTDSIVDYAFSPASITVTVGSTVTWTNTGARPHTVTADDGSFDSGSLSGGATFSQTFAKAGAFAFHCAIHPGMKGTVVVQ